MDTLRETTFGQILYHASGRKIFRYPEEQPDFVIPERWRPNDHEKFSQGIAANDAVAPKRERGSPVTTPGGDRFFDAHHDERSLREAEGVTPGAATPGSAAHGAPQRQTSENSSQRTLDVEAGGKVTPEKTSESPDSSGDDDPNLVDWYGPDDPANPLNWSQPKKVWVTFNLCFLTFSIYFGASVISPAIQDIAAFHGVGIVVATLGITLFVVGYGVGPMVLSPLSEIPAIGRNPPYIITLAIFVVLQVPTAVIDSLAGFLILRFLAGVFGSPALSTGGATISDIYIPKKRAPHLAVWGLAAVSGPSVGPVIGGFASQHWGWRWSIWPLLFATGAALVCLFFTLPETSAGSILHRRAARLRRITGNDKLYCKADSEAANMTLAEIARMTLVRPFSMTILDPLVLLNNMEIGLVYAVLFTWLEAFPIVFGQVYGFNRGVSTLPFLAILVGALVTWVGFCFFCKYHLEPIFDRKNGHLDPEDRLKPAFGTLAFLPISLFGFGWTSTASIHWIVPTIFAGLFSVATFSAFQSVLNFLADAYPQHVASAMASNDLFRSVMGAAFPLFARQMFNNLQAKNGPAAFPVAWGCTLLGCISLLFVPLPMIFYRYGSKLRQKSRYAS